MNVGEAIAYILGCEGVDTLIGYPVSPVIEPAAAAGIRPIIVRQERTGVHMADSMSRMTSGRRPGVFTMQMGPGSENSFGGVAQSYSDSVPILVLSAGHDRRYAIDETKARSELGYAPRRTFAEGFAQTLAWYLANETWWRTLVERAKLGG